MENGNHETKIDVRIIVSGLDIAQLVSKAVNNIQLERDYNIIVSSIIPTVELDIVKKVFDLYHITYRTVGKFRFILCSSL